MSEFSPEDIVAYRFTRGRRKGYDTLQVDGYLERLAAHVRRLEDELARHQATERAALELLQQAQVVADETVDAARREADQLRQNATAGLDNARADARSMLGDARAEADRTLLSARVEADTAIEQGHARIAELDAAGAARTKEYERVVHELRRSAAASADELRAAGSRLVKMAEYFESELAPRSETNDAHGDQSVSRDDPRGLLSSQSTATRFMIS